MGIETKRFRINRNDGAKSVIFRKVATMKTDGHGRKGLTVTNEWSENSSEIEAVTIGSIPMSPSPSGDKPLKRRRVRRQKERRPAGRPPLMSRS